MNQTLHLPTNGHLVSANHVEVFCALKAGKFLFVSPSALQLWGYSPEELVGKKYTTIIQSEKDDADDILTKKSSGVLKFENRVITKEGSKERMVWSASWDKDRKVLYCIGKPYADVAGYDHRLKLASSLADYCSHQLQHVLENLADGFFSLDHQWRVTYINRKAQELFGKSEYITGKDFRELVPTLKNTIAYEKYKFALATNTPVWFEFFSPRFDAWFEVSAYPSAYGLSVYFRDISDRIKKEKELHTANERFRLAAKATSEIILDWDLLASTTYFSHSFTEAFGYALDEKQNCRTWANALHPDDSQRVLTRIREVLADPTTFNEEDDYRLIKADGSVAYVRSRSFIVRDAKGKAIRVVGAMQDVTSQRQMEDELELSAKRYQLLFYESPIPRWVYDADTLQFVEVNDAAVKHYGYTREEFKSMSVLDIRPSSELGHALKVFAKLRKTNDYKFAGLMKHRKKNGEAIDVEICSHGLHVDGKMLVVVFANDVSDKLLAQKKTTKAIINAQEQERNLIGKELHDNVNQLLTTAKLYVQNIGYFPEQKEVFVQKSADIIQKCISEIRSLSKALITPTLADLGFSTSVQELIHYYNELNLFQIDFVYKIEEKIIDKELQLTIYRILQELFNNTVKYAGASRVHLSLLQKEQQIVMCYADNGIGFDLKSKSSGIGIRNIKSRTEAFKGNVSFATATGKGLECSIEFPVG